MSRICRKLMIHTLNFPRHMAMNILFNGIWLTCMLKKLYKDENIFVKKQHASIPTQYVG